MSDIVMRVNDRLPFLDVTLSDANGVYDLSTDIVRFVQRSSAGTVITDQTSTDSFVVVVGATSGRVRYKWQSTDVEESGNFLGEFEVTNALGEPLTFPNNGHIEIVRTPELSS